MQNSKTHSNMQFRVKECAHCKARNIVTIPDAENPAIPTNRFEPSLLDAIITQIITSGGLWHIESDSDDLGYLEQEQLAELKQQLRALGFSTRAISKAFQDVQQQR